jgi:hypothetical protein
VTRKQKNDKPKKKHRLRRLVLLAGAVAAALGYRNQRLNAGER